MHTTAHLVAIHDVPNKQSYSSPSHRGHSIMHVDDIAQIVEPGELPVQVSGVVVVGDCCVRFEAEIAEMLSATITPNRGLPAPMTMGLVNSFEHRGGFRSRRESFADVPNAFSSSAWLKINLPIVVSVAIAVM